MCKAIKRLYTKKKFSEKKCCSYIFIVFLMFARFPVKYLNRYYFDPGLISIIYNNYSFKITKNQTIVYTKLKVK